MESEIILSQHLEENCDLDEEIQKQAKNGPPNASINPLSMAIRGAISERRLCSMFCGGKKCKYCDPVAHFTEEDIAIPGLFSHWVTDNILAMSRPSSRTIETYNILQSFKKSGITSIINLQRPGEHASCGDGVESTSGFSYHFDALSKEDISFYNFGWKDYGTAPMTTLLDMVRVMQFALSEGKVAVHCHAGLGRTGVIIACYLVFNNRFTGSEAALYVRKKRPGSLQTGEQVACVSQFHEFLRPFRIIFHEVAPNATPFSIFEYLRRQNSILRGWEARELRHLPKIVFVCIERLLDLALGEPSPPSKKSQHKAKGILQDAPLAFDRDNFRTGYNERLVNNVRRASVGRNGNADVLKEEEEEEEEDELCSTFMNSKWTEKITESMRRRRKPDRVKYILKVAQSFVMKQHPQSTLDKVMEMKTKFNTHDQTWNSVRSKFTDPAVLSKLLLDWLEELKTPVLRAQDLAIICENQSDMAVLTKRLKLLEKSTTRILQYMAAFVASLWDLPDELDEQLIERILSALCQLTVTASPQTQEFPSGSSRLRHQSLSTERSFQLIRFFSLLVDEWEQRIEK